MILKLLFSGLVPSRLVAAIVPSPPTAWHVLHCALFEGNDSTGLTKNVVENSNGIISNKVILVTVFILSHPNDGYPQSNGKCLLL